MANRRQRRLGRTPVGQFVLRPLQRLAKAGVIEEEGLRIEWTAGMASALDKGEIAASRDIGSIRVKDVHTDADVAHDVAFAFAFDAFFPNGTWMLGK